MDFEFYDKLIDRYDQEKYSLLKAQTFDPSHYGFPPIYYKIMETDQTRVGAFKKAFAAHDNLRDAVVCEAGIGTLALTKHYLPYVKKAYLIENNPDLKEFIEAEIQRLGFQDKVELIFGDAMQVNLPEPVDFVIGELMSIYCANEFQVQIFQHLRNFLKPGGKLMPEKIINTAQLVNATFEEGYRHYPLSFTRHWPELLSLPAIVNTIDLYNVKETIVNSNINLECLLDGEANAILMQSMVQLAKGVNFTGTDSLMPPTLMQTENIEACRTAHPLKLLSSFEYGTDLDRASFKLVQ